MKNISYALNTRANHDTMTFQNLQCDVNVVCASIFFFLILKTSRLFASFETRGMSFLYSILMLITARYDTTFQNLLCDHINFKRIPLFESHIFATVLEERHLRIIGWQTPEYLHELISFTR